MVGTTVGRCRYVSWPLSCCHLLIQTAWSFRPRWAQGGGGCSGCMEPASWPGEESAGRGGDHPWPASHSAPPCPPVVWTWSMPRSMWPRAGAFLTWACGRRISVSTAVLFSAGSPRRTLRAASSRTLAASRYASLPMERALTSVWVGRPSCGPGGEGEPSLGPAEGMQEPPLSKGKGESIPGGDCHEHRLRKQRVNHAEQGADRLGGAKCRFPRNEA